VATLLKWLLALILWLPAVPVIAQSFRADYNISFSNRKNQYVDVSLQLPVETAEVELVMPSWTPGSYLIREYAAQLERLRAVGNGNKPLALKKVSKNRWRVSCDGESEINVSYSVWAGKLAVSSSWVEQDFALLNGASIFLFSEKSRNWPQSVSVELPKEWKKIHTSLPRGNDEQHYVARNYDELVDSPMLLGNAPEYRFTVANQDYVLVNQGENQLWDGPQSARDVAGIVSAVQAFWQVNPLQRPYVFLNVIAQGNAGLEHDYSTVLLTDAWQMRYREEYVRWLALVTHEFFHAWNVRRMRPEALRRYDYEQEAYTRELWLAEGLTSYYDNLLLFRSGLIKVEEYLTLLADEIRAYEMTPGRHVRSAELASLDAWIKHYKPDANTLNSTVSYYRKGSLIGFVTDMAIRRETKNRASLDTLMREMYRQYGPQGNEVRGYPQGAFETLLESLAGVKVRQEVSRLLTTTSDPEIDEALQWYGLELDRAPARTAAIAADHPAPAGFGVLWNQQSPSLVVEAVLQGGTGAQAGMLPADELLAIDGFRVSKETLADRLLHLAPGEMAELLLVRHGQVMTLAVALQEAIPEKYQILIRSDINRRQKERMSSWLGAHLKFIKN